MCSISPNSERNGRTFGAAVESDGDGGGGDIVGTSVGTDDVGIETVGEDVGVAVGASEGDATGATVTTGISREDTMAVVDCG
jgi:hypothetical protein